jgi:uncharacterized membrane protein YqjE
MDETPHYAGRKRAAHSREEGLLDITRDAFRDIGTLLQTEMQLFRAEMAEKLALSLLSASLIAGGALLLAATVVLLLQTAIAGLVAYGFSWAIASLLVAVGTLLVGCALIWFGFSNLSIERLAPSKTLAQLQKDGDLTNAE